MESPGRYLKRERELRNLSLEEVAKSTKIRKHILWAMEEDRRDLLPPSVYVKGFLATYARYLGLDPNKIILHYQKHGESLTPLKEPKSKLRMSFQKKGTNFRFLIILGSIFIITCLITIFTYYIPSKHVHWFLPPFEKKGSAPEGGETQTPDQLEKSQNGQPLATATKKAILTEPSWFEVIEASLGTGIEWKDNFLILTRKCSEFVCDNQRAYFLTRIKANREGKVVHVWRWKGEEFYKQEIEIKPPGWSVYSFITLRLEHAGDWSVEVREGDNVLAGLGFKVYQPPFHSAVPKQ